MDGPSFMPHLGKIQIFILHSRRISLPHSYGVHAKTSQPLYPSSRPPHKTVLYFCDQQRDESLDETCEDESFYLAYTANSSDPDAGLLDYTNLPDIYDASGANLSRDSYADNAGNMCDDPCQPTSGGVTCSALVCLEVKAYLRLAVYGGLPVHGAAFFSTKTTPWIFFFFSVSRVPTVCGRGGVLERL